MIVRLRNYSSYEEASREWGRFGLPSVAESARDLYDLGFFFAESREKGEVEALAFAVEELGGDAYRFQGGGVARAMLVFEHGVLQSPSCRLAPDDRLRPVWSALSNYLSTSGRSWRLAQRSIELSAPVVMGILNVTPDSFSDGGRYKGKEAAVGRALEMVADGAAVIDVGGESTRPYAEPVAVDEELRRVIPVVEALVDEMRVPISVDTRHHQVAEAALEAGAGIINDVEGLRDPRMAEAAADAKAGVVIMHMQGAPNNMQDDPGYVDVVGDISLFLEERARAAKEAGVREGAMVLDPGIGFGKDVVHNLQIVLRLREFSCLGHPLLVGASRKGFIGKVLGQEAKDRKEGSLAIASMAMMHGADIVRAHDVRETVMVAKMVDAVRRAEASL
ncbi:MAG: dihydropteroate synthase [Methanomassiliicoccales archaeon]|jgi:dihydropteroate synthase|nr:dihydropteroate synthase [Methanomassiliicoccales archaeon]